jgi:ribosome maturation factor RimP
VVVDRDGGVDLDLVAAASHRVSDVLDEPAHAGLLPGPFVLEVTSPGVDRPLTETRHWRRARTRLVKATLRDGTVLEGRVTDVPADDQVVLATEDGDVTIDLAGVQTAVVQVELNRAEAQPEHGSGEE